MNGRPSDYLEIECTYQDLKANVYAQSVKIRKHAPIMSCKNMKKLGIFNNQEFKVINWDNENIIVINIDTNEEHTISIKDFHKEYVVSSCRSYRKTMGGSRNIDNSCQHNIGSSNSVVPWNAMGVQ
eukprot:gene8986-10646_t